MPVLLRSSRWFVAGMAMVLAFATVPAGAADGPPSEATMKAVLEKHWVDAYSGLNGGEPGRVTFQWVGEIKTGQPEQLVRQAAMAWPAKLDVVITVFKPKANETTRFHRGAGEAGPGQLKANKELFMFYKDSFGEWVFTSKQL